MRAIHEVFAAESCVAQPDTMGQTYECFPLSLLYANLLFIPFSQQTIANFKCSLFSPSAALHLHKLVSLISLEGNRLSGIAIDSANEAATKRKFTDSADHSCHCRMQTRSRAMKRSANDDISVSPTKSRRRQAVEKKASAKSDAAEVDDNVEDAERPEADKPQEGIATTDEDDAIESEASAKPDAPKPHADGEKVAEADEEEYEEEAPTQSKRGTWPWPRG